MGKKEKKQSNKKTVSTVSESSGNSSEKSTSGKSSNQFSASQSAASSSKPKGKSKSLKAKPHKKNSEHGSSSEAKKKTKESSKLAIDGHGNTVINIYVNGENARLNFVLPDAIKKGLVGTEGVRIDLDEMIKKDNNDKDSDMAVSPAISVTDQKKADGNPK